MTVEAPFQHPPKPIGPSAKVEITLELALRWARELAEAAEPWADIKGWADVSDERERYRLTPMGASDFRPLLDRQWECSRRGEQFVYANEEARVILIETFDLEHYRIDSSHVEVWATQDGYEDRLDELAGVAVSS